MAARSPRKTCELLWKYNDMNDHCGYVSNVSNRERVAESAVPSSIVMNAK